MYQIDSDLVCVFDKKGSRKDQARLMASQGKVLYNIATLIGVQKKYDCSLLL